MRTVADAMIAPPAVVEREATLQAASAIMLDAGTHAAVVIDNDKVCGLATAEDIGRALAAGRDVAHTSVSEIAERDLPILRPHEPLAEAHQRMRAEGFGALPVAGAGGAPVGLLVDPEASPTL